MSRFLQRHQGLIIPRKVSEKWMTRHHFLSSLLYHIAQIGRTSSSFLHTLRHPSPRFFFFFFFFIEDNRIRYQPRFIYRDPIYWSFKITVGKGRRGGGDETKHSCKKILQRVKSRCVVSISVNIKLYFCCAKFLRAWSTPSRARASILLAWTFLSRISHKLVLPYWERACYIYV